jgi:hypothetical protein
VWTGEARKKRENVEAKLIKYRRQLVISGEVSNDDERGEGWPEDLVDCR